MPLLTEPKVWRVWEVKAGNRFMSVCYLCFISTHRHCLPNTDLVDSKHTMSMPHVIAMSDLMSVSVSVYCKLELELISCSWVVKKWAPALNVSVSIQYDQICFVIIGWSYHWICIVDWYKCRLVPVSADCWYSSFVFPCIYFHVAQTGGIRLGL